MPGIMHMLLSAGGAGSVTLDAHTIEDTTGIVKTAAVTFGSDGSISSAGDASVTPAFSASEWNSAQQAGIGDHWEIQATFVSGNPPTSGPSLGFWHSLSSDRIWTYSSGDSGVLEFEIRLASSGSVAAAAEIAFITT